MISIHFIYKVLKFNYKLINLLLKNHIKYLKIFLF